MEDGSNMWWRWVEGSRWKVDGVLDEVVMVEDREKEWDYDGFGGKVGWIYYDNKVCFCGIVVLLGVLMMR